MSQLSILSTYLSQIWSTMALKVDFPRCRDRYVPHEFRRRLSENRWEIEDFDEIVKRIKEGEERVVLITAPPGMGKSRALEEIHAKLIGMRSHAILFAKLSHQYKFWKDWKKHPTIKDFLLFCTEMSNLQEHYEQRLNEGRLIVMCDEIGPVFEHHVIDLIKELLDMKGKVVITTRPQEMDRIIKGLNLKDDQMIIYALKSFDSDQQVLMLQTRLNKDEPRYHRRCIFFVILI